jgi:hypothetical protein
MSLHGLSSERRAENLLSLSSLKLELLNPLCENITPIFSRVTPDRFVTFEKNIVARINKQSNIMSNYLVIVEQTDYRTWRKEYIISSDSEFSEDEKD